MPRTKHIDTSKFEGVMAEAMKAYSLDPDLACQMARNASAILRKRAVWNLRTRLRDESAAAVVACAKEPAFLCENSSACGVGPLCKFSSETLALIQVGPKPGKGTRPQPHADGPSYDTEYSLAELVRQHEASRQLV